MCKNRYHINVLYIVGIFRSISTEWAAVSWGLVLLFAAAVRVALWVVGPTLLYIIGKKQARPLFRIEAAGVGSGVLLFAASVRGVLVPGWWCAALMGSGVLLFAVGIVGASRFGGGWLWS